MPSWLLLAVVAGLMAARSAAALLPALDIVQCGVAEQDLQCAVSRWMLERMARVQEAYGVPPTRSGTSHPHPHTRAYTHTHTHKQTHTTPKQAREIIVSFRAPLNVLEGFLSSSPFFTPAADDDSNGSGGGQLQLPVQLPVQFPLQLPGLELLRPLGSFLYLYRISSLFESPMAAVNRVLNVTGGALSVTVVDVGVLCYLSCHPH